MTRIAIVGGGIAGLSAAYALEKQRRAGSRLEFIVFESGPRFGGVVQTERVGDFVIEAGPDSFLTEKSWGIDLCRELGLGDQLIASNDSQRKTYILVNGRLVPLPDGLMFMVPTNLRAAFFSPLFPWPTKLRMVREWFYRPMPDAPEATVAEFVERHYGKTMVERLAGPLVTGVYGGSAEELSASAVLPRFTEIEAKQGSLGRAMVAARKLRTDAARPIFTSLKLGMQQIIDALVNQIPGGVRRLNTKVESVRPESGKWLVRSDERTEEFDAVIIAAPAFSSAELLRNVIPDISTELQQISYTSSVTVALAYDERVRRALSSGFGFLVPDREGKRMLACTFVHQKFPHRVPEEKALLRCFLGGSRDETILQLSDQEIEQVAQAELRQILGITARPLFVKIYRWPKAMAQYEVGHKARVEKIRQVVSGMRGLALAGNAYNGIGIPDCVRSGSEAASKLLSEG
ncbi:MAG TPA: protoporphyrinogen oxidase [Terriglobales bacterium]|jgi:oxygen-dependent protoporphyrinogen oxidase